MPYDNGYYYGPDHSEVVRGLEQHFRNRGVVSERKILNLTYRWIKRKGYRLPNA